MRNDKRPLFAVQRTITAIGLLVAVLMTAGAAAQSKPAVDKAAAPKRLIRMEAIAPRDRAPAVAKRDIFSPGGYLAPPAVAGPGGRMAGGTAAAAEAEIPEAPPAPALNLRFMGFSLNPAQGRIIGLILLDGKAMAVAEGETLDNGWTVVRVARREIEVRGPDGKTLTFALEGAER
jgi:hypothetical protein